MIAQTPIVAGALVMIFASPLMWHSRHPKPAPPERIGGLDLGLVRPLDNLSCFSQITIFILIYFVLFVILPYPALSEAGSVEDRPEATKLATAPAR
jgi:hypothetical protein